jgi:UTP--glucose-1-phosphate uridylyltransferase
MKVRKAIIPVAGLGSRFLPLSKEVPKELWPLADKPVIQYIVEEARDAGIEEIIFVSKPGREMAFDYFKNRLKSKKTSFARYKSHFQKDLENLEDISKKIVFHQVFQKEPLGAAHAVFQAEKFIGKEPCAVLWADDVVESKVPCLLQLIKIFNKYQKPVIAIYRVPKESFHFYGMIKGKKIGNRLYRFEDFIEKPETKKSPSDLAIVGKYIITPEIFERLRKTRFDLKSDITLSTTVVDIAKEGGDVYGYDFEGKWLECGNKLAYLKSNFYLSLKSPQFGKKLKSFIKNIK